MKKSQERSVVTLFLAGDVMVGRGIDQILPHPSPPNLYEPWVKNALDYVRLAEKQHGAIPRSVEPGYIWGDLLPELDRFPTDIRIVNLETAVTTSEEAWPDKGINYRMHPENIAALTAAGIDVAVLANNHVLDWGYPGLKETLSTLDRSGIGHTGAGKNLAGALAPCITELPDRCRVLVFAAGMPDSGVPLKWAASEADPGISFLPGFQGDEAEGFLRHLREFKGRQTIIMASIHWGPNWGHLIPREQSQFAHRLIDEAGVDIVHGHSSHHPKGIELYRGKLILYGCGDLINDYEGIEPTPGFAPDLGLAYLPRIDVETGQLVDLRMIPVRTRRFRLCRPPRKEIEELVDILNRHARNLGRGLTATEKGDILLRK